MNGSFCSADAREAVVCLRAGVDEGFGEVCRRGDGERHVCDDGIHGSWIVIKVACALVHVSPIILPIID